VHCAQMGGSALLIGDMIYCLTFPSTYDHRTLKTRLPVRSALFKQRTGGLVVRWVTTSEYPLLYVFWIFFCTSGLSNDICGALVVRLLLFAGHMKDTITPVRYFQHSSIRHMVLQAPIFQDIA
jgi:hypothetical protein